MDVALPARQRKSHAKSSGGCGTCKARRVKCDEAKPVCERCCRAQKTCSGYATPPGRRRPYHRGFRFVNTLAEQQVMLSPKSSSPSVDTDTTLIDFFTTATMPRMQSYFEDRFLKEVDPQLMRDNEVLRHASITLCLQHMLFGQNGDASNDLRLRCTQAYVRSLSSFHRALDGSKYDPFLTAQASMLLATVESMRGNSNATQAHLTGAMNIMQQPSGITEGARQPSMSMVRSCIAKGFNLALHTVDLKLFNTVRAFAASQEARFEGQENDLLGITLLIDFIGIKVFEFMVAMDFSSGDPKLSWQDTQQRLLSRLASLEDELETLRSTLTPAELPTAHVLHAKIKLCTIFIRRATTSLQTSYDLYQDDFTDILDMIQEALYCLPASARESTIFSPEINFVTTVASVAKLCRHPTIRRRALDMLRLGPAQEGIWNAADARQVCEALMDFEELGTDGLVRLYVAEEHRIHHISLRQRRSDSDDTIRRWIDVVWRPDPGANGWERGFIELPSITTADSKVDDPQGPHLADTLNLVALKSGYDTFDVKASLKASSAELASAHSALQAPPPQAPHPQLLHLVSRTPSAQPPWQQDPVK